MTGGLLPASLACAALGLALAFASLRAAGIAAAALLAGVVAGLAGTDWATQSASGPLVLWASVALTAAAAHIRPMRATLPVSLLALNAGFWSGAALSPEPMALFPALGCVLLVLPGAWLVTSGRGVAVRVAASWLITVGVLSVAIPITTPTPGYVRDHGE